jgi:transcriptional regulator with XRE-family HTH domain
MKYDGYQVGIVIKSLRIQRNLTKEALAAELGISESTIKKYENGERALSITNLFKIIDYFKVDANTILNVAESKKETSIDSRLELMDCSKRAYFQKIFNEMLDSAEMLVSLFPTTLKFFLFILLSPLRLRIGEFWRLHSRGVLFLSTCLWYSINKTYAPTLKTIFSDL